MKYVKKFESFIDAEGNLQQSGFDQEIQDEISKEDFIDQFNAHLKDFLNKEYVFDVETRTYTWTSDSENTQSDKTQRKSYRLKKVEPIVSESLKNPGKYVAMLKLKFTGGTILKRDNLKFNLSKTDYVEIPPAEVMDGPHPLKMKYKIHFGGDFDKKKTFPRDSWFTEYYVADYPTQEKLKELRDIVEQLEYEANNTNRDELD
jgi:hypothetical protein